MRPTFMGFETATRGLMANQKSLDVVGNNVTNIGVTGYTRQRVDLVSLNVNMRYTRYNMNSSTFAGQGVAVYGVSQVRDKFLDKRFREEYADVGYYSVTSSVLDDLSASLDEIAPATISDAMYQFQQAVDSLLQKNNEATGASNMLAKATQLVQVLRQMSAKVDNVWNQQEYSLRLDAENVNSILARIAELNDIIPKERFNSMDVGNTNYQPNELLDQRNVLLDQLSQYADITYKENEKGEVTVKMGGHTVVDGTQFEKLSYSVNDNDPEFKTFKLFWNSTGQNVDFGSGSLRGALDMLNGRGLNGFGSKGEVMTQGILYYKDKVDELARALAGAFNNSVEIADLGTGQAYVPPRYKTLFAFKSDSYNGAGNILINTDWEDDPTYLYTGALDKIVQGSEDNSYASKLVMNFKNKLNFGEFNGTLYEYVDFYSTTKLGNDKAFADSRLEAVSNIADNLLNQIQQVSGVSMEEEGVDMLMYKKAYDAVSRVFTTLDEMLDKLINGTGVVGR